MITVFNRRELMVTFSAEEQARVCAALQAAGVDCAVKVSNRNASSMPGDSRTRMGRFGENTAAENEYRIFVRKEDYDRAAGVLHDCTR